MTTTVEVSLKAHGPVKVKLETPPTLAGLIEAFGEEAVYNAAISHWANRVSAGLRGFLRAGKPLEEALALAAEIPLVDKRRGKRIATRLSALLAQAGDGDIRDALSFLEPRLAAKLKGGIR